jgi:hypothetical protein
MRDSSSSFGVSYGRPLARDPWANGIQPDHNTFGGYFMSGLGESPAPTETASLGELQPVGWMLSGAAIGWAASAYSTGQTTSNTQVLAAWGGASAAVILLGIRRLVNGDQNGIGPTLLGAALGISGYFFGESSRTRKKLSNREYESV